MIFGRKVHDEDSGCIAIEIGLAQAYLFSSAARGVILKHCRIALLEFLRHPFAHDTDAVDGVHSRLRLRRKQIAYECFEHGSSDYRKNMPGSMVTGRPKPAPFNLAAMDGSTAYAPIK